LTINDYWRSVRIATNVIRRILNTEKILWCPNRFVTALGCLAIVAENVVRIEEQRHTVALAIRHNLFGIPAATRRVAAGITTHFESV